MNNFEKINLFILVLLLLSVGCGKNPADDGSSYGDTIIANNVIVIDDLKGIELFKIDASGNIYTYKIDGTYNHSIVAGKIIVGTEYGGYIRRVTRMVRLLRELELTTVDATLTDVVTNGLLDTSIHLGIGIDNSYKQDNFELVSAAKGFSPSEFGANLSGLKLFSGVAEGVDVDVEITNGFLAFDPWIDYGIGIKSTGLKEFYATMKGDFDFNYDMAITGNGKFGLTGLKNIAQYQHFIIHRFGTIPVVEVISLAIDIGFEITATINGTIECGFDGDCEFVASAGYKDEEWWSGWEPTTSYEERPLSWPGNGLTHVNVFIRPRVGISFFSVPSTEVSIRSYVDFNGRIDSFPEWCWQIKNGIDGSYGFQLQMLGYQHTNYSDDFSAEEWPMGSDCETVNDITSPAPITNLDVTDSTSNSILLSWTATGDDANIGKASEYDIRYSKSLINSSNWETATQCLNEPNPEYATVLEEYSVEGLTAFTQYFFAMRVADEIGHWSDISNIASGTTKEGEDYIEPSPITDLFAGNPTSNSLILTWTAMGDDGTSGTASYYDIRFSTEYINNDNWARTISCQGVPSPGPSGTDESFVVQNLVPNTIYYFAMRSADEELNWSLISNMAGERTLEASERGNIIGQIPSPVPLYTLDLAGTGTSLWVIDNSYDTVYNIDQVSGDLLNKFVFEPGEQIDLQGIAWDGNYLWIASRSDIYKVNSEPGL